MSVRRPSQSGGTEQPFDSIGWEGPAIGLLDLDAFFASVEQLDHPEWRGRPLIVGGDAEHRGVVSTASYEARRYGVHSAMPAAQARRLCPQAIWTRGNFVRYREMSDRVMDILLEETPLVEQVSIDEAFFDVTPGRFSRESPVSICQRVRDRVASLGVTCSIGLGVCKSVAKIASEAEKPRGLTFVLPGTESAFLAPLPVRALSGIGAATQRTLEGLGIRTLGQLARADTEVLRRRLGSLGPMLQSRAAASERVPVAPWARESEPKSVSNERTFAEDLVEEADVRAAVDHVCALVGRRLRRKGLRGRTVTLKVKYDACHARSAQAPLATATDDEGDFSPAAQKLVSKLWAPGMGLRLVGVGLSDFSEDRPNQLELFGIDEGGDTSTRNLRDLHVATDALRERFGDDILGYGRDLRLRGKVGTTAPRDKDRAN